MKYESDCICTNKEISNRGRLILSPIREFDIFASRAREVVFADVNPAITDVIKVRENFLIENHLVGLAGMTNGIKRAFSGGSDRRDANINRIKPIVRALWEIPLCNAGRRGGARL